MKSTKVFNNISDKLKAEIPSIKPGETVTFQMLNGVPNPEPDEKERSKNPILYGKRQVQTNFRIYDPYKQDEDGKEVGGYVDVGCVDSWNGENPLTFRFFVPGIGLYSHFQGKFSLTAGNIKDMELYEILWLSNERNGNPYRDKSVEPLFELVDLKAETKQTVNKVSILRKSLDISEKLKTDVKRAREIMAALNQPSYQDDDVLMAKIADLASSKPDLLIKTYENKETPVRAILREALNSNILSHDLATGKLTMDGLELSNIKVGNPAELVDELTRWVGTAQNGKDVLENIKSRLEKKEAVS